MDKKIDERQEALLKFQKRLYEIESKQKNGTKYYTVDELDDCLIAIVK